VARRSRGLPLQFPHFRIVIGDQKLDASLAIVGRTKNYGGPFKITTGADLFEDQFEIMALTTQSGLRYLSYLPTLWMGNLRGTEGVHFHKSDTVICEPLDKNPIYAQVDGEPLARLPVQFKNRPPRSKTSHPRRAFVAAAFRPALFSCFFLECGGLPPLFFHAQPDQSVRPPGFLESLVFVGLVAERDDPAVVGHTGAPARIARHLAEFQKPS